MLGLPLGRENATLSFAAPDYDGVNDIHAFLSYLALVEPAASASLIEAIDISDEYNIILTSRPRASVPAVLWACSYLVFMEGHPYCIKLVKFLSSRIGYNRIPT